MQRKSNYLSFLFHFSLIGFLLAAPVGCSPPASTTPVAPVRPFDTVTLKVACPGEPARTIVERYGRGWATHEGVRLDLATYEPSVGPDSVAGADAWLIEPAALGRWAAADKLEPLPDAYTQEHPTAAADGRPAYDWAGLLPLDRERLLRWADRAYALPVLGEAPVCFYRQDLLSDPAHRAAFRAKYGRDLAPPTTWDEFAVCAEFFAARPGVGPSLPPLATDDDIDREYYTIAASYVVRPASGATMPNTRDLRAELFSFHCDFATGEPRIATPGFVHALQMLERLQKCRAPADSQPAAAAFAGGKAVLCLADASWIARLHKAPARPAFGICRVPGSTVVFDYTSGQQAAGPGGSYVPYLGARGCLGVVPRNGAHHEAVLALLAELSGPATSRQIAIEPEWGGGVVRRSQLEASGGWSSFGMEQEGTAALLHALQQTLIHTTMGNPATRLRLPNEAAYRQVLLSEVRAVLAGKKSAADALKAADQRWRTLDPPDKRRIEYAYSLGLTPP
jgi:multiple sugar transport system substrate-binding protein